MFWKTEKNPKMTSMERKFLRMAAKMGYHDTIIIKRTGNKGIMCHNTDTGTSHHGDITRQGRIE